MGISKKSHETSEFSAFRHGVVDHFPKRRVLFGILDDAQSLETKYT